MYWINVKMVTNCREYSGFIGKVKKYNMSVKIYLKYFKSLV